MIEDTFEKRTEIVVEKSVNPFSTKFWTPGAVEYEFDDDTELTELVRRIFRASVVQVVGPHGSGKSTLLESLARHFEREGCKICRAFLNDRQRELPNDFVPGRETDNTLFILDGFEQLSFYRRCCLRLQSWQKTAGLVLTSHRPLRFVPVIHRTKPSFERFRKMVEYLTEGRSATFDVLFLRRIFDCSKGNFRTAFFMLYDLIDEIPENVFPCPEK